MDVAGVGDGLPKVGKRGGHVAGRIHMSTDGVDKLALVRVAPDLGDP
jgi:hypothetical protein